jgi:hypothetical protein
METGASISVTVAHGTYLSYMSQELRESGISGND